MLIPGSAPSPVAPVAFWVTSSYTEEIVHHSLLLASARSKLWVSCLFLFHSTLMLAQPTNLVHVFPPRTVVTCQDNILFLYRHYFCRRLFSNWPKIDVNFLSSFIVLRFLPETFCWAGILFTSFRLSCFVICFLYSFFAYLFDAFETGNWQ